MIGVTDDTISVDTKTLAATFERGFLVRLLSKVTGEEYIARPIPVGSPLQLVYDNGEVVDVLDKMGSGVTARKLSPRAAEFRFHGWEADGVLSLCEEHTTGELLLEPSAYSSRPGVLSCRWRLGGVRNDLGLVAPFFQGVKLPLSDPLLAGRWHWPIMWEAALAILEGPRGGFWVHCRDDRYRYKAINIENTELGFETEAYGPLYGSIGAGGLVWRLNCYSGDWKTPASVYRDWLYQAYGLREAEASRKPWVRDIRLAVSWYNGDPRILDALAEKIAPSRVLLHFSAWRTDAYDENYPIYEPSESALQVFQKARSMGFHIMPHCNSVDMDPTNQVYPLLRDFQYRDVRTRRLLGWAYDPEAGGVLGVPNSYWSLAHNRHRKVMVKIHPGLAMWRSILAERIAGAVQQVHTDAVFIDVTLCSHNIHNCLVENTTLTEGMKRLIEQVASLGEGLAVGGEGLNEITMQGLSFAQAHLFRSWHDNCEGLERTGGCALNEFLFGSLCRTFGYSRLSGATEAEELRMRIHEDHGAIPTITVRSPGEIALPNRAVQRAFDLANSQ